VFLGDIRAEYAADGGAGLCVQGIQGIFYAGDLAGKRG
jgi:hypothetical protein